MNKIKFALLLLLCYLFIWLLVIVLSLAAVAEHANGASYQWHFHRQASYYSLPGNRTACGQTMTTSSVWVSALKPRLAHCRMRVTICHASRCRHLLVLDRGAWRTDRRDWDLSRRAKQLLGCSDLCTVRWRKGW